ncbi:MAG: fibronectin type III domain-containing protein [Acidobacteriota bacterium]
MVSRSLVLALPALVLAARPAFAGDPPGQCHVIDVDFVPAGDQLQIVAWVEKPDGTFVDTIYITQKTGLYGLGNRPGRFDFNSGPQVKDLWPYGRRITVFPVWAHRHGLTFPEVDFQNADDNNLSHPFSQSSMETQPPFCRPMMPSEAGWDTGTCASTVYTDKGIFSPTNAQSLYPPRADVSRHAGTDSPSVDLYKMYNPYDAVTQATPAAGMTTEITWPIPTDLPPGDYVVFMEVSEAFDFNSTYNATTYPPPSGIPWSEYGMPYRGQPSVVYSVPFTISTTETTAGAMAYVGYGDPSGTTGTLNPPDGTIDVGTIGKGAGRLQPLTDGSGNLVEVRARPEFDSIPPALPSDAQALQVQSSSAVVQFVAPGGDGQIGKVAGYEIRYRANDAMTPDNFADSTPSSASVVPSPAGSLQSFEIDGLLPSTDYWIGVRAYDDCHNYSDVAIVQFTTADRQAGEVNACFIATAAYGSIMANDVEPLRRFRDVILRGSVLGELAIETYYTFSPPVAGVVGESELLRRTARDALAPVVAKVKTLAY